MLFREGKNEGFTFLLRQPLPSEYFDQTAKQRKRKDGRMEGITTEPCSLGKKIPPVSERARVGPS